MAWQATFDKGVACFRRGDLEEALTHMNQVRSDIRRITVIPSSKDPTTRLQNWKAVLSSSTIRAQQYTKNSAISKLLFLTQNVSLTLRPTGGRVTLVQRVSLTLSGNMALLSR